MENSVQILRLPSGHWRWIISVGTCDVELSRTVERRPGRRRRRANRFQYKGVPGVSRHP